MYNENIGYYIAYINENINLEITSDNGIARRIGISFDEYSKILQRYNVTLKKSFGGYYFEREEECLECIEYLEETYGIIIKLMEE